MAPGSFTYPVSAFSTTMLKRPVEGVRRWVQRGPLGPRRVARILLGSNPPDPFFTRRVPKKLREGSVQTEGTTGRKVGSAGRGGCVGNGEVAGESS